MSNVYENRAVRPIRIITQDLILDGLLNIGLGARTLDELNQNSKPFMTLSSPVVVSGAGPVDDAPIAVNRSAIQLALEIPDLGIALDKATEEPEIRNYGRAAVRLRVGAYSVEGFVHTGPGGNSLLRLNNLAQTFMALVSATVRGGALDFATPFVAVSRHFILSAQELYRVDAVAEEVAADAGDDRA